MTKLYRKSEITFAILWIVAYVALSSTGDQLSREIGIVKSVTAVVQLVMSVILLVWIGKNHLNVKYGLCPPTHPAKEFLYYLPLAVIALSSLWGGVELRLGAAGTVCYVISMCCVGFLEEIIFRGLLFRAMEKDNLKSAIIVSAVTFGLGHIVNLFNGSGRDLISTFHAVNNALGAFEAESAMDSKLNMALNIALIIVVLGGYLLYLVKKFAKR